MNRLLNDDQLTEINTSVRGSGIELWRAIAQAQLDATGEANKEELNRLKAIIETARIQAILNNKTDCSKCLVELISEIQS